MERNIMRELNVNEIEQVDGGCAKYCWGEATMEGFVGAVSSGARFGLGGAALGAAAYALKIMWF
ncbi:hypothetical protein BI291_02975 [Thalassotalea sp. PP2-459]|nr:hypothetical protein BI291_02975 [Thalassotalea sp. PP2-459]